MISFSVYSNAKLADKLNLSGAYVVGSDDVPLRAELAFKGGTITCKKRAAGPAGLALLWEVQGAGLILIETIRVQERDQPYILQVELARGRLMRIAHKLEDWGLFDFEEMRELLAGVDAARDILIRALQADDPATAAEIGQQALEAAVQCSEDISRFHASALFTRRKQSGSPGRRVFGCTIALDKPTELARKRVTSAFDFAVLPIVWRDIEPTEQAFTWKPLDAWVEALSRSTGGVPLRGSALLAFTEQNVPDWLYIWEHDFDTIRDLAFEHVRRVVNRYGQHIQAWTVISGIHAPTCFVFGFEQLMELTRMAAALVKQISPRGTAIVELVAPFGEYYARNQRTIPPLLYADMVVQSGVSFDAFGLRFQFGQPADGMFVRDLFAVSALLDQFAKLGKPLHITGVEVPSQAGAWRGEGDADGGDAGPAAGAGGTGGYWREPWSESTQADWLQRFYELALSKPFIESICWNNLWDASATGEAARDAAKSAHGRSTASSSAGGPPASRQGASSGLLRSDLAPKTAYKKLLEIRQEMNAASQGQR